jgi:D-alanine-D-alanine ligase
VKRRVLLLTHEELVPPDSLEELDEADVYKFQMELDVLRGLGRLGHEVQTVGVKDEIGPIRRAVEGFRPHVVFNLVMHFHGIGIYDSYVVSFLELLRQPYTGCNPRGLILSGDKVLTKKILTWHRVPVPPFELVPRGRLPRRLRRVSFPLFVKSSAEHSSTGIAQASIVRDEEALAERVRFVHEKVGTDALVEEYVPGRELYVGVLGNERLETFPVWELTFDRLPEGTAPIATQRVKWDLAYQRKVGVQIGAARGLPPDVVAALQRTARRVYRALGLSGYARIDFRLGPDGGLLVLEANPNPDLCVEEEFASSARRAGLRYEALLRRILSLGIRYGAAWKDA